MSGPPPEQSTVLVVDDEVGVANLHSHWLSGDYRVKTAYSGREALELLDDSIDVVLLDRRMPELAGDEVLRELRSHGLDCRVALVTAVEPDFDIIDMGLDDYLIKPVSKTELLRIVERLLTRTNYDSQMREYFALVSKMVVLDGQKKANERADSPDYSRLERRIADRREQVDTTVRSLDEATIKGLFSDISTQLTVPERDVPSK